MNNQQILSEKNTGSSNLHASAILVSWNSKEILRTCLTGLLQQKNIDLDIFVVDNNSSDETVQMLRMEFPRVRCISNTHNAGFSAANNQVLRIAKGDYLILLNPDIEFSHPYTLSTFLLEQRKCQSGIAGPKLLNTDGSVQKSVRSDPTFASQAMILLKLHIFFPNLPVFKHYYRSDFNYHTSQLVDQISGAFFSISRECFEKVGLLDERFYIWFEEVDYCFRARKNFFSVRYISETAVTHHGGQSFQKVMPINRQKVFNKSLRLFAKKYFNPLQVFILSILMPINIIFAFVTPKSTKPSSYRLKP